ncbi:Exonuclease mut-7 [Phytophthora citrophthora]|uniref:Exonuclease mut-7 n=1 Tax=Phytophthora citrophthora TaxID=4793 RepID=A0AAD9FYU8_9STRA|nr:Exonuclease mut-7 [Phytophthora citrophthora]
MSTGRSLALGVYFSTLLEFWLRFCPYLGMEKMEIGKQIISSTNRTVGQLKFLFRCNFQKDEQQDFHVESSVKFFLLNPLDNHSPNDEEKVNSDFIPLEQYVGPHLGENLAWRVQEVERKLAMRRGESVRLWLEENYSDTVQSYIVLRGYLFEPLHHFVSTSETTRAHDWHFHRNPVKLPGFQASTNPSIAADHLRGWWTTDVETDLPAKVRANNVAEIGESRFVVLPKLHWLCPVIAIEDGDSGQVFVEGDNRLEIPDVAALSLDELLLFVRDHFQKASVSETNKSGGVAMPLLVAEIVPCPKDVQLWYELSRGFILDPKCWDPSPLCHEPVRFRRTLKRNGEMEREYGIRREDCTEEGFIKPDTGEAITQDRKQHSFADPAIIGPRELCLELVSVLSAGELLFTHAELKRSTRELLLWKRQNSNVVAWDESAFLCLSLESLVLGDDDSKHSRRVGYLLLDVFDGLKSTRGFSSSSVQECSQWVELFTQVASVSDRWEFLNLILRAIDLTLSVVDRTQWTNSEKSSILSFIDKLLAARNPRWNAVVVEVIRVFRLFELGPKVRSVFTAFVDQSDWQSAERLAVVTQDPDMLQSLFKTLSLLNMTKALKRLQKTGVPTLELTTQNNGYLAPDETSINACGDPIEHVKNRSLNQKNSLGLKWQYVDSLEGIGKVLRHLIKQESTVHSEDAAQEVARKMIIGIDCEWRPQFLRKEQSEGGTDDQEGLSIYQLAVGDVVYVIDVQVLETEAAAPLSFIWRSTSRLLLIGFCVSSDVQRIKNSFPQLKILFDDTNSSALLLELKKLALFRHVPAKHWGLSKLYSTCFGETVDKEQQCSDWGSRPLSTSQIEYAAKDAYAVQRLSWHLLADVTFTNSEVENCSTSESVREFMKNFDANLRLSPSWTIESASQPLGKQHVKAALEALELEIRFLKCGDCEQEGLIVKSIALVIRKGKLVNVPRHAVAVLPLDRSIDMQALGTVLEADPDDIYLADQETLVRIFGYSRGCLGPIGLREQQATRIIVDDCLQSEKYLLCGAGIHDEVYAIAPDMLVKTLDALVACIST